MRMAPRHVFAGYTVDTLTHCLHLDTAVCLDQHLQSIETVAEPANNILYLSLYLFCPAVPQLSLFAVSKLCVLALRRIKFSELFHIIFTTRMYCSL